VLRHYDLVALRDDLKRAKNENKTSSGCICACAQRQLFDHYQPKVLSRNSLHDACKLSFDAAQDPTFQRIFSTVRGQQITSIDVTYFIVVGHRDKQRTAQG